MLTKIFKAAVIVVGGTVLGSAFLLATVVSLAPIPDSPDIETACIKADIVLSAEAGKVTTSFNALAYEPVEGYQLPMTAQQAQDFFVQTDWQKAVSLTDRFDRDIIAPAVTLPYECAPFLTMMEAGNFDRATENMMDLAREAMRQKPDEYAVPGEFWQWYGAVVPGFMA